MRAASLTALVAAAAAGPIDPEATSGESTPMVEPYGESVAVPFVTAASSEEGSGGAVVLTLLRDVILLALHPAVLPAVLQLLTLALLALERADDEVDHLADFLLLFVLASLHLKEA